MFSATFEASNRSVSCGLCPKKPDTWLQSSCVYHTADNRPNSARRVVGARTQQLQSFSSCVFFHVTTTHNTSHLHKLWSFCDHATARFQIRTPKPFYLYGLTFIDSRAHGAIRPYPRLGAVSWTAKGGLSFARGMASFSNETCSERCLRNHCHCSLAVLQGSEEMPMRSSDLRVCTWAFKIECSAMLSLRSALAHGVPTLLVPLLHIAGLGA
jgi:hypothetical protein